MSKNSILELIAKYLIREAFEMALDVLSDEIKYELVVLSAKFEKAQKEYFILCILNDAEYNIEVNKIITGFVNLVYKAKLKESGSQTITEDEMESIGEIHFHPLHQFPRGPMVPLDNISPELIRMYAELIDHNKANEVIGGVIRYRKEADNDDKVTTISISDLPPHDTVPPVDYWRKVFHLCCLHGPRMLGALLFSVPDEQFTIPAKKARRNLIAFLASM